MRSKLASLWTVTTDAQSRIHRRRKARSKSGVQVDEKVMTNVSLMTPQNAALCDDEIVRLTAYTSTELW